MFSLSVVDTDKFLEMPISARLLYYELGMRADDDGFVGNWKKILLFTGLKNDDLKILISKQFVIPFESGVIVIRHWRMNNYLQNDRTKPTIYQDELKQLGLDENNVYTMYTNCIRSIDKNSIEENSIDKKRFIPPSLEDVTKYINENNYTNVDPNNFYDYFTKTNWIDSNGKKVKSWKGKIVTWNNYKKKQDNISLPDWFDKDIEAKDTSLEEQEEITNILNSFN